MSYEQRLRLIGRMLDERSMRGICLTETREGLVIVGEAPTVERDQDVWEAVTIEVGEAELARAQAEAGAEPRRKRWGLF